MTTESEDPTGELSFEDKAKHLLAMAAETIRGLQHRNSLLQVKSDTVDALCSLGKHQRLQYGETAAVGAAPNVQYRIDRLLLEREEFLRAKAEAAKAAAATDSILGC